MPSIPRRSQDADEDQRTLSSGDPLAQPAPAATPESDPTPESGATSQGGATAESGATSQSGAVSANGTTTTEADQATVAADPVEQPTTVTESVEQPTSAAAPVEQPTTVVPAGDPLAAPQQPTAETGEVAAEEGETAPADARPRFRQRTRMRRRLRYLRRLRELAFRDLGGLVFDLHRFGRERSDLVTAKLEALTNIDRELRTLQERLRDRRDFTDLREAGIAACPRCGTLHDTDANFCPGCGTSLRTAIVRDASPVTVTPADDAQPQQPATPS
jgi:zinc-ribbon domain